MTSQTLATLTATIILAIGGIAQAQSPPTTVDGYITAAKVAAGTDALCVISSLAWACAD